MTAVTKVAPRMASALPVCTQPFYRGKMLLVLQKASIYFRQICLSLFRVFSGYDGDFGIMLLPHKVVYVFNLMADLILSRVLA